MKKKVLTILFASVLSAGMLTGCFGNNRANDNNSTQNSVMDDATTNVDQNSGATDTTNNVNQNDTNDLTDNGNSTVTDGTTGNGTDNNANVADNGTSTDNNGTNDVTSPDGTNNNTTGNKNNTGDTLISEKEASEIALSHIKGADTSHLNIHQETEDGRTIYEGTITYNDREHHFEIDANSGEILEWDMELLTR